MCFVSAMRTTNNMRRMLLSSFCIKFNHCHSDIIILVADAAAAACCANGDWRCHVEED